MVSKNGLIRTIEISANVLIIVVALLLAITLFKLNSTDQIEAKSAPSLVGLEVGSQLNLVGLGESLEQKTVLLVLSTRCRFCVESMPFYRELINAVSSKDTRFVAIFPEEIGIGKAFLSEHGLPEIETLQSKLSDIKVRGTPTVILTNRNGVVESFWMGKLDTQKQKELVNKILVKEI